MAFDFSTLVTDRTQQDVAYARQLVEKLVTGTATEAEIAEWNSFTLKGVYNHTDLNRVTAAMDALKVKLEGYGYAVPGYQRITVPHNPPSVPSASRLPEGYLELTCIESTGTQYIDTGFKPSGEDMQVVFDFAYTASHSASSLFGTESNSNYTIVPYNQPAFYVAKSTALLAQTTALNTRYVLDAHANNGTFTLVFNGIESVAAYSGSLSKDLSVFLLASNKNGSATQFTSAKLYSCKIYDNGVLVRDYVPCKNASGVVGLYDIANGVFYQNAGTGAFAAGEEIVAPATASVMVASGNADEYDPYLWYEFDWPTPETMTVYLLNVSVIRSVLAVMTSTPKVPADMVGFMTRDANDIETILLDVYRQLVIMPTTFVACGEAFCGGDNL